MTFLIYLAVTLIVFQVSVSFFYIYKAIRFEPVSSENDDKSVSILIPYYNETPQDIIDTLNSIANQNSTYVKQVVLVNDGSNNGCNLDVENHLSSNNFSFTVDHIQKPENGGLKSIAMNYGYPYLSKESDYIVVIDSDTVLAQDAIRNSVSFMESHPNFSAASGAISIKDGKSMMERLQYYEHIGIYPVMKHGQSAIGFCSVLAGAFCIHRKGAMDEVGHWQNWLVEDISWTWKARVMGNFIGYIPTAHAYTTCPVSMNAFFKQRRRWARGRIEAFKEALKKNYKRSIYCLPWLAYWMAGIFVPFMWIALSILKFDVFIVLFSLTMLMNFYGCYKYQVIHNRKVSLSEVFRSTLVSFFQDWLVSIPHFCGVIDEIFGRKKVWATR
ncbi:glycosyltransferase family 2 protein [Enterovibrio sp. ZSDZ35]|uniref:Glycosyltransferase family 2 protein n=1 Tax=Enterovibrio qingdaonensis TaxID=2899818 RepID=A0ABT5QJ11_9GAMM|nr:glycosyltransferase family 2 protein [Enterovibrio sp. ZSDZ35]MDD1780970.1 glycosyltransferase family 2 protein [Enterovibrio sp. ZSDZ35]